MVAIQYIVGALLWLVVFAFLARVVLQLTRADFRNPIAQAVMRVTNPLVMPLRRVIPPARKVDLASIVALLLVQLAASAILLSLDALHWPAAGVLLHYAVIDLAVKLLQFYVGALLIYVLLSWVAPGTYSPANALLESICEPVLAPVRRLIPPIAGLDLSALFLLIALQALLLLLRS